MTANAAAPLIAAIFNYGSASRQPRLLIGDLRRSTTGRLMQNQQIIVVIIIIVDVAAPAGRTMR